MAKKHTLIKSFEKDHVYTVTIGTDMGEFTGSVLCREIDRPYESRFFGYELAEIKAEIQYARAKRRHYAAQLDALAELWASMKATKSYNSNIFWVPQIKRRIAALHDKVEYWRGITKLLQDSYHHSIVAMDDANQQRRRATHD